MHTIVFLCFKDLQKCYPAVRFFCNIIFLFLDLSLSCQGLARVRSRDVSSSFLLSGVPQQVTTLPDFSFPCCWTFRCGTRCLLQQTILLGPSWMYVIYVELHVKLQHAPPNEPDRCPQISLEFFKLYSYFLKDVFI